MFAGEQCGAQVLRQAHRGRQVGDCHSGEGLSGWVWNIFHKIDNGNNNLRQIKQISEHVRDHYAALLGAGQLVGVAVGGAEEALFDWDHNKPWGN